MGGLTTAVALAQCGVEVGFHREAAGSVGSHAARRCAGRFRQHSGEIVATLCSRDRRVVLACKSYLRAVAKMPPEVRSAYALVEQTQFAVRDTE